MQSTLNAKDTDPHDIFAIEPEVVSATRANREHLEFTPPLFERAAPAASTSAAPSVDAAFRAAASDHAELTRNRSAIGKWARRAAMGFMLALCSAFAAAAWKHHGAAAREMIAGYVPQFVVASWSEEKPAASEPASAPAVQTAAVDQTAAPEAAPVEPAEAAAPTAPAAPAATPTAPAALAATPAVPAATASATAPDTAQLLRSMARDVAAMGQQIEGLKASIAELKASQDQMSRDMAKAAEARAAAPPVAQPKVSALPPRPPAPPVRKPKPVTHSAYPAQAAAAPAYPPPRPRRLRCRLRQSRRRPPRMAVPWCVRRCRCARVQS
jgi:hypothetical protein